MFTSLLTTILLAITAAQCAPLSTSPPTLAPLYRRTASTNNTRYIVSFHQDTVDPSNRLAWVNGLLPSSASAKVSAQSVGQNDDTSVVHHWDPNVFNGLAGSFDEASLAILRAQSQVAYIEEDAILHKSASTPQTQTTAPWGLSRLSTPTALDVPARFNPTNRSFTYTFPSTSGSTVDIYIVDTGVHTAHTDFGGRATFLASFGDGVQGDDKDGHGTHVAGTTAGASFGVAKKASIFAIKVLDDSGSGPISDIISGLNAVATRVASLASGNNSTTGATGNSTSPSAPTTTTAVLVPPTTVIVAPSPPTSTTRTPVLAPVAPPIPVKRRDAARLARRAFANANNFTLLNQLPNSLNNSVTSPIDNGSAAPGGNGPRRAVVNMSLGGSGHSNALDAAVQALVAQGVVVVVAAGNDGVDVADASPADVAEAITVGAMDVNDNVPNFSNFGAKVDIFAPGAAILSCGITSNRATAVLSGTSMATPHIAGLSAVLLGEDPSLTPAQVKAKIQALAVRGALKKGIVRGSGTQNLVAQDGL